MCRPVWNCSLRAVVVVGRPHRADDGDVVDAVADVRPPVADLDAALAVLLEADLQRDRACCAAGRCASLTTTTRRFCFSFSGFCASLNGVSAIVLPAYLFSAGLGSKLSMWLTPPIMNSQMTLLAFGGKVRLAVRRGPGPGRSSRPGDAVAVEHRPKRQAGEAHAHVGQEAPAWNRVKIRVLHIATFHCMVTKSLWFSRT